MRYVGLIAFLATATVGRATDLHEIKPANPIPPHQSWMGWMKLCFDSHNDCFLGMIGDKIYAFRYAPAK